MPKLMIFCTCAEYKKEFYLKRVSNWFHNLKMIKSLQELDPDYYVFNDGKVTLEDIKAVDESLIKESHLFIRNHEPMLGRTSDLCFPGWIRSFKHALEIGMEKYDYIVHIENDVLLLHPDKIVSYFNKEGMYCSYWCGREIIDSTVLVMNSKEYVKNIYNFLNSRDISTNMLIEGVFTSLAPWKVAFKGGRLENEPNNLTMDLDFIAQINLSKTINPLSKAIVDATVNHVYVAMKDNLLLPDSRRYIPIQCTAESTQLLECYHDNDNPDNIANKARLYGNLTALYAAWKLDKSISDNSGIGFLCNDMWLINGYYFMPNHAGERPLFTDVAPMKWSDTERKDVSWVNYDFLNYDIVIPTRQWLVKGGFTHNVISFIMDQFGERFYMNLESVIRDKHYDYAHKIWKDYAMDELVPQVVHPLFIMKKHLFDAYCELLFSVCKEMEESFDNHGVELTKEYQSVDTCNPPIFERLAPYILGLFIYRNKLVVKEAGVVHYVKEMKPYAQPFYK